MSFEVGPSSRNDEGRSAAIKLMPRLRSIAKPTSCTIRSRAKRLYETGQFPRIRPGKMAIWSVWLAPCVASVSTECWSLAKRTYGEFLPHTPPTIMNRVPTYHCTRIRRWVYRSNDTEPLPLHPFYRGCIIDKRGYDFRKGQASLANRRRSDVDIKN
jgi:hypothetical protein